MSRRRYGFCYAWIGLPPNCKGCLTHPHMPLQPCLKCMPKLPPPSITSVLMNSYYNMLYTQLDVLCAHYAVRTIRG
jgi:hypothetical protein